MTVHWVSRHEILADIVERACSTQLVGRRSDIGKIYAGNACRTCRIKRVMAVE